MRIKFNDFLGEYEPEDVFAFSTDFDRTKMTLQLVLAGLYPPSQRTSWSDTIHWSPIPIFYETNSRHFLYTKFKCPRYCFLYYVGIKITVTLFLFYFKIE